ncbi:MAG: TMEM175 family protein [Halioglobus sp.]
MTVARDKVSDIYLDSFSVLANVLFALCMFSSVLKIDFAGQNLSDADLIPFILSSFNSFANFVVAFIFLAMYWIKFVGKQAHLVRSNNPLLIIWLFYLALLCLYPFAENLIGNYPDSSVAQIAFSAIWAIIGIVGLVSWWYASYAKLIDPELGVIAERRILWESMPEPIAALISIPFALFSDVGYYLALLLVVPANYYISVRFSEKA